ncbi:membrane transport protein XK [Dunckerocampus dactyliophorus]|uniref:membrane transport protein XK n=1 Tax=Dunckerocampus dactyliophorus TaxID=161453 RepID=UPI002405FD8A|nr:membrane transport protein XK [Dunckerocampus dactyliophorus]
MRLPSSIFVSVCLFTAETTAAIYLSTTYTSSGDQVWLSLTLLFTLVPSVLVQLALTFVHRDLSRDKPLTLLLHILQLGPVIRCLEAFWLYGSEGRVEEPYVSITRKKQLRRRGHTEEVEHQVGQAEGKLIRHRAAFARTSVIQAFLGSAPQLSLQLYICILERGLSVGRVTLMVISLLSIVYGALRCNILAIKIKYDDYEVHVQPMAYMCIILWRGFEITTRVLVLVLFSSVLKIWVLPVVVVNFLLFFFYPWILFWKSHSPFPENIEKTLSRLGTTITLCMLTLLYAGINMFCWSVVQVKLADPDLISKSQNWYRMAVFYMLRFIENASLLLLWYINRTDFYLFLWAPLIMSLLLLAYTFAVFFMLVFYQFYHPCRSLFTSSMTHGIRDCCALLCLPCSSAEEGDKPGKEPGAADDDVRCDIPEDTHGADTVNGDVGRALSP